MTPHLVIPRYGGSTLREVVEEVAPTVRQSLLSSFDDCHLSALFEMRYGNGWHTHPQARGVIFHRTAAHCLRVMREQGENRIPTGVALELLEEELRQRDLAPGEPIVTVPERELPDLEMAVRQFSKLKFTIRNLIAVEERITQPLKYVTADGERVERWLSGAPDCLIAAPPDGAVIIDWKATWALPPERDENDEKPGISYYGYFQQRFYAWLVMRAFPSVKKVTLREFYIYRKAPRPATIYRADLERIEEKLAAKVELLDRALMQGDPGAIKGDLRNWEPSPGKHCAHCLKPGACPIENEARGDGAVTSPAMAERYAAERATAKAVMDHRTGALKPWCENHNAVVPLKNSKGRRVIGYRTLSNGKPRFEEFTPSDSDRGPDPSDVTVKLADAMEEGAREAAKAKARARRKKAA